MLSLEYTFATVMIIMRVQVNVGYTFGYGSILIAVSESSWATSVAEIDLAELELRLESR